MIEDTAEFRVSAHELEYLNQLVSRDESLSGLPRFPDHVPDRRVTLRLSRADAERLRDSLTKQLAVAGFDGNYRPNERGKMLEELIDRFYTT
jgi:hypothetical protein